MRTNLVCVVWGQQYTNLMLNYCIPSLLAVGNLPDWPYGAETILYIYTTAEDQKAIQQHASLQALAHYVEIQIHPDLAVGTETRYDLMNQVHHRAIDQATQRQAALMCIAPDHVFSTHCFTDLLAFLRSGSTLILSLTPRISLACEAELLTFKNQTCLDLPAATATDMFTRYLHPTIQENFANRETINNWCSQIYYYQNPHQVVVHSFHLHPIFMVEPPPYECIAGSTIDGDYLQYYDYQRNQVKVVTDNRLFILSLTDPKQVSFTEKLVEPVLNIPQTQLMVDQYRRSRLSPIHFWLFRHQIVLQGTEAGTWPELPDGDNENLAFKALRIFWDIEEAWLNHQHQQIHELYAKHRSLLHTHLPDVLQAAFAVFGCLS